MNDLVDLKGDKNFIVTTYCKLYDTCPSEEKIAIELDKLKKYSRRDYIAKILTSEQCKKEAIPFARLSRE